MGNQVAARTHTERGQELLCERESHIYKWELAGLARHAALQPRTLDGGERGVITPTQVHAGNVEADGHRPGTGLLSLENTHNSKGGGPLPDDVARRQPRRPTTWGYRSTSTGRGCSTRRRPAASPLLPSSTTSTR